MKLAIILLAAFASVLNADLLTGKVIKSDFSGHEEVVYDYDVRITDAFYFHQTTNALIVSVAPAYDIRIGNDFTNSIFVGTNEFRIKRTLVTNVTEVVTFERVEEKP